MSTEIDLADPATSGNALPALREANQPARASFRLAWRNSQIQANAEITPLGLLAIGGMVGAILLAVAPIVSAARSGRRHR
ncbi:MAG TPA: hypothetical protein VIL88_06605 [Devosia sp.]|jgi:hypothetical protein|uniref:hypothetical protein n=1 Tax=Devosia sp. TaxID=1871048 RepID=UPI002F9458C8